MKNKTKIIVVTSVFMLSIAGISSNAAHATIGGRVTRFFSSLISNIRTTSNREHSNITKNLTGNSALKAQVEDIAKTQGTVGSDANELGKNIINLKSKNYYFQKINEEGRKVTHTSSEKPKILSTDGHTVTVRYKDLAKEEVVLTTDGAPRWISGKKAKKAAKSPVDTTEYKFD